MARKKESIYKVYDFKGGDNFKGVYRDFNEAMMRNELTGGTGAYELSWAEKGKSGPSFGGNQMDLSSNPKGRSYLLDIVKNAKDAKDAQLVDNNDIKKIISILNAPQDMAKKSHFVVFKKDLVDKIDAALQSEYGVKKIHEAYVNEVNERAAEVEKVVSLISNPAGKKFAMSDEGKTFLFDYHNQIGLSINGALHKHLNNEKTFLKESKRPIEPHNKDEFTRDDLLEFLKQLDHYKKYPGDVMRRFKNIEKHFKNKYEQEEYDNYNDQEAPQTNDASKVEKDFEDLKKKIYDPKNWDIKLPLIEGPDTIQHSNELLQAFGKCMKLHHPDGLDQVLKLGYGVYNTGSESAERILKHILPYENCVNILAKEIDHPHDEL